MFDFPFTSRRETTETSFTSANDVELGHGHLRPQRQLLNHAVKFWSLFQSDFLGPVQAEHDLAAEPIADTVRDSGKHEGHAMPFCPP